MFNLILKDILLLRIGMLWVLGMWLLCSIIPELFGFQYLTVSLMIAGLPMGADDKSRTESLLVSLPVKRTSIVIERYIFTLLAIVFVVAVTYISYRLLNMLFPAHFAKAISLNQLLTGQVPVLFFMSMALPLHFRFGSRLETGIRVVMISLMVMLGSLVILFLFLQNFDINVIRVKLVYHYLVLGVIMLGSLGISLWIYRRREF